ncbi:MAG: hypothetical protein H7124_02785 [Phycisphaerales bacterium]|nr:hypothetical protein [Hyphomonadaceae bacterium]
MLPPKPLAHCFTTTILALGCSSPFLPGSARADSSWVRFRCCLGAAAGQFYESIVRAASAGDNLSGRAARWGAEKMMRKLENEPDPALYIERASFTWVKPAGTFAAAALAIAAIVTFRELNAYTLYFADHYEQQHTFLPSHTVRSWSDATRVEVGCNHVTGDNASDEPIYEVHFGDGGSIRIDSAFPLSGTWIDQVEKIDVALVGAGADFQPWSWMDRNAYHPRCLMAQAMMLDDENYARLRHLIRAPE